jgi:hypothetical protein
MSDPNAKVQLNEYMTACYGTTEYPEDMMGIVLKCVGQKESHTIDYAYKCREESVPEAVKAEATIPQVDTRVAVLPVKGSFSAYIREGYAFSPMYTLGLTTEISNNEEVVTCLKLEKAN